VEVATESVRACTRETFWIFVVSLYNTNLSWKPICANKLLLNFVYWNNIKLCTAKSTNFQAQQFPKVRHLHKICEVGKWNYLSITYSLSNNCTKNYYNRTPTIQVIVEDIVTLIFLKHSVLWWCLLSEGLVSMSALNRLWNWWIFQSSIIVAEVQPGA